MDRWLRGPHLGSGSLSYNLDVWRSSSWKLAYLMRTNATARRDTGADPRRTGSSYRPFGVTAIAFLQAITSVAAIYRWWDGGPVSSGFSNPVIYINALSASVAFTGLIVAVGLLLIVRWAWPLALFVLSVQLGVGLWAYYQDHPSFIIMVLNVASIFYLNSRDVREAFGFVRARDTLPIE
jgi:hypothetical protein